MVAKDDRVYLDEVTMVNQVFGDLPRRLFCNETVHVGILGALKF